MRKFTSIIFSCVLVFLADVGASELKDSYRVARALALEKLAQVEGIVRRDSYWIGDLTAQQSIRLPLHFISGNEYFIAIASHEVSQIRLRLYNDGGLLQAQTLMLSEQGNLLHLTHLDTGRYVVELLLLESYETPITTCLTYGYR